MKHGEEEWHCTRREEGCKSHQADAPLHEHDPAYPPVMPNLVRLRDVLFISYRFLQTLPLPATPLRFGLSSPYSG